jgi:hypothetical protein
VDPTRFKPFDQKEEKLQVKNDWRVGNDYSDYLADKNFHFKDEADVTYIKPETFDSDAL